MSAIALLFALCLLAAAAAVPPAHSQTTTLRNYKLSGDAPPFLDVQYELQPYFIPKVQISPDGKHVVFWADYSTDGAYDIYSVALNGGVQPARISNLHSAGTSGDFLITPDSTRVIYWLKHEGSGAVELNSVPISGGAVTPLSDSYLTPADGGSMFEITADSEHVIYFVEDAQLGLRLLFSVPTDGGPENVISPPAGPVDVVYYVLSPDGSRVVFTMDTDKGALYSVPSGGGTITPLVENLLLTQSLYDYYPVVSPDSSTVYYILHQTLLFPPQDLLFGVPIDGGDADILYNDLAQFENNVLRFITSPDGERIAVLANYLTQTKGEIYVLPAAGGDKTPLNMGELAVVRGAVFSPAGDHIVFTADPPIGDRDMFSAPVGGGAEETLDFIDVAVLSFEITPDGERVVYKGEIFPGPANLYSVPLNGGPSEPLNLPLPPNAAGIAGYKIAADSQDVIYLADQQAQSLFELYRVPVTGGQPLKLNKPLPVGAHVGESGWAVSPDGRTVVYVADQEVVGKMELYATALASEIFLPHVSRGQ